MRMDRAGRNLQIDHRPVAHIGPPARQPVGIIAVPLQVLAPGHAPKRLGDGAAFDADGCDGMPLLLALLHLARRSAPTLPSRNIGPPSPTVVPHRSRLLYRLIDVQRNYLV